MLTFNPTDIFKALADETRLRMMLLIARETELCVCELSWAIDESQPKISRHLALLRSSGMLSARRQGQWMYYSLHPELPAWVRDILLTATQATADWLLEQTGRLTQMGQRPQRLAACC